MKKYSVLVVTNITEYRLIIIRILKFQDFVFKTVFKTEI